MLGLAAIAGSVANPPERGGRDSNSDGMTGAPPADDPAQRRPARPPAERTTIRFRAGEGPTEKTLDAGNPAEVLVEVDAPAQVYIPSLGLTAPADPLTPARFDVLADEPGRHRIVVAPADPDADGTTAGTLKVVTRS